MGAALAEQVPKRRDLAAQLCQFGVFLSKAREFVRIDLQLSETLILFAKRFQHAGLFSGFDHFSPKPVVRILKHQDRSSDSQGDQYCEGTCFKFCHIQDLNHGCTYCSYRRC